VDEHRYFLRGEIDVSNADESVAFIHASTLLHSGNVSIDCMDLLFIDAAGINALVALSNELREQGRTLSVVHVSPFLGRVLDICGLMELLGSTHDEDATPPLGMTTA
jgi:anti-anti-sigma factor